MSEKTATSGAGIITIVIVIAVIIGGLFLLDKRQARQDCEDRALVAATDQYPINEYPDTAQRSQLQEDYEQRYLQSCE
jgi:uncharacterized protein YxeA